MVQVLSKLSPIKVSCLEVAHPWTDSCLEAICGAYLQGILVSFRMYAIVYVLALLMRCKIPTKEDIKKTCYGILQSTAFLSGTVFGYVFFQCGFRRLLGHFNLLTVSAVPVFLASVFALLIERPSRHLMLSLYVSNHATETIWNMAVARKMVHPIRFGKVIMFSVCIATLLACYKTGLHKKTESDRSDSMFDVLRFVVGPYEEKDYTVRSSQASTFYRKDVAPNVSTSRSSGDRWSTSSRSIRNPVYHLVTQALRVYKMLIYKIKCLDRHPACPHPFSCLYYTIQGAGKMFGVGLGIQIALKLVLNMKRIFRTPKQMQMILFRKDNLFLALFLGGFSGLFTGTNCVLRRIIGRDSPYYAIPAGLIAGIAFNLYPDTTVALYVLWKMAQITYNLGIDKGVVPKVPGFTQLLYCFSSAILFHAVMLEPATLTSSYWNFLHSISGGRFACMNRIPLDVWDLNTSQSLQDVLKATNTIPVVQFYT